MLETLEILFDFGLLVLIWMVQLIVYPSFLFYGEKDLVRWHQVYTGRIAMVVIPLMFGELGISAYQVYEITSTISIMKFILIVLIWISTFAYFAPTHGKISQGNTDKVVLTQLVNRNWWRTLAWTLVSIISFTK